ncbi:hypothetical protein JCM8097_001177 [Rhodosporidiobolus ruineniae]
MGDKQLVSPSGMPSPHHHAHRPRLSPKDTNLARPPPLDYFVPPTPAQDHPAPAWSPFVPSDQHHPHLPHPHDENARQSGRSPGGGQYDAGAGQGQQQGGEGSNPWAQAAAAVPPSFTLSPSSAAFNTKFTHLLRGPNANNGSSTPLHPPPASPFFLSGAPTSSAATGSSAVPPTPGPGTTAGLSFPPASSSSSTFKLPSSLSLGGRKLAGRPGGRPQTSPAATINSSRYTLYNPQTLFSTLQAQVSSPSSEPSSLLVLDIRTHTAFLTERLATSLNICVPSTLLRRPGFGIDRVQEGLPPAEQAVFERWASCSAIVVLDAESTSLAEGGGVASLLAKFEKAGFEGKLGWVKGGWYAVKTQLRALPPGEFDKLVEVGSPAHGGETESSSAPGSRSATPVEGFFPRGQGGPSGAKSVGTPSHAPGASTPGSKKHARPVLQVRDLPIAAFQLSSTTAFASGNGGAGGAGGPKTGHPSPLPTSLRGTGLDINLVSPSTSGGSAASLASQRPGMGKRRKSGNEGLLGLGGGGGSGASSAAGGVSGAGGMPAQLGMGGFSMSGGQPDEGQKRMSTNPFFDNIRQNSEALSLERSLSNLTPVDLPCVPAALLPFLPHFLQSLLRLSPGSRAKRLARQFYELEAAEKERLEGTFRWHAQQTAKENARAVARAGQKLEKETEEAVKEREEAQKWERFGISAGVELGNLNRFKNIFPYEHARVKLTQHSPSATDYVNASYLHLRTSSKRYIASQGPLPSTFRDFWQMCDQESVGVIIMLTNLNEGGRDKCGRYWVQQHDGEWDVDVEGDLAHEEEAKLNAGAGGALPGVGSSGAGPGGFFAAFDAARVSPEEEKKAPVKQDSTIRRTITVSRRGRSSSTSSSSSSTSRPRKIRHIQYRAWPDFDIPADPADVVSLVHEVDAAQRDYMREVGWKPEEHDGLEPPILAHCSAGVGRTGVFIMVSSLLEKLRRERGEGKKPAPFDAAADGAEEDRMDIDDSTPTPTFAPSAPAGARPKLEQRLPSDPETSLLSTGLSLSSLESPGRLSPAPPLPPASSSPAHPAALSDLPSPETPHHVLPPPSIGPALQQSDPVFAGVNELREQRMSMVANYRQYVCVLECVIEGAVREMQDEAKAAQVDK